MFIGEEIDFDEEILKLVRQKIFFLCYVLIEVEFLELSFDLEEEFRSFGYSCHLFFKVHFQNFISEGLFLKVKIFVELFKRKGLIAISFSHSLSLN